MSEGMGLGTGTKIFLGDTEETFFQESRLPQWRRKGQKRVKTLLPIHVDYLNFDIFKAKFGKCIEIRENSAF